MRKYELVLVLRSSLTETQRKEIVDEVKAQLQSVSILEEHDWGSKALAYPIKHELTGHYIDIIMQSETGLPVDLEKRLLANTDILRHLLIRTK